MAIGGIANSLFSLNDMQALNNKNNINIVFLYILLKKVNYISYIVIYKIVNIIYIDFLKIISIMWIWFHKDRCKWKIFLKM